jgi:hypothetical protein
VCSEGDTTEFGAYEMDNGLLCRRWRREVAKTVVTEPEDFHGVSMIPNVRTALGDLPSMQNAHLDSFAPRFPKTIMDLAWTFGVFEASRKDTCMDRRKHGAI